MSRTKLALAASAGLVSAMFAVAAWPTAFPAFRPAETASAAPAASAAPVAPVARDLGLSAATAIASGASEAMQVSAADLWGAYMRDPAAADRQYRDRSLVVSGIVRSIDRDFDGGLLVRLSTGGASDTVNAKLATRADPTSMGMNRGKEVSLLCVGRGSAIGAPLLGSCFFAS